MYPVRLHLDAWMKPKENPDGFLLEIFPSEPVCPVAFRQSAVSPEDFLRRFFLVFFFKYDTIIFI
jgi:hypothetical protein